MLRIASLHCFPPSPLSVTEAGAVRVIIPCCFTVDGKLSPIRETIAGSCVRCVV